MILKCLVLLGVCAGSISFGEEIKKISVSGQCTAEVSPDHGSVNFVAERIEKDSATAIKKATELHETLRAELKKLNIKDLELASSEYNVQEKKEWENSKSVSKGFVARIGLRASTSDIASLGKLMEVAGRIGVTETNQLSTSISDFRWLDAKKRCLDTAAKNAEEKAQTLVKSMHAKLGKVFQINEVSGSAASPVQPLFIEAAMMKSSGRRDAGPAPTIEGQKQTLVQEVQIVFLLE